MSNLPASKSTSNIRKRVLANNGAWWGTWYMVTDDGTLIIDPQGRTQYKAGEWRYIVEREVKTITYEELGE